MFKKYELDSLFFFNKDKDSFVSRIYASNLDHYEVIIFCGYTLENEWFFHMERSGTRAWHRFQRDSTGFMPMDIIKAFEYSEKSYPLHDKDRIEISKDDIIEYISEWYRINKDFEYYNCKLSDELIQNQKDMYSRMSENLQPPSEKTVRLQKRLEKII